MEKVTAKHNSKLVTILYVAVDLTWALVSEDGLTKKYKVDTIELEGITDDQLQEFVDTDKKKGTA